MLLWKDFAEIITMLTESALEERVFGGACLKSSEKPLPVSLPVDLDPQTLACLIFLNAVFFIQPKKNYQINSVKQLRFDGCPVFYGTASENQNGH